MASVNMASKKHGMEPCQEPSLKHTKVNEGDSVNSAVSKLDPHEPHSEVKRDKQTEEELRRSKRQAEDENRKAKKLAEEEAKRAKKLAEEEAKRAKRKALEEERKQRKLEEEEARKAKKLAEEEARRLKKQSEEEKRLKREEEKRLKEEEKRIKEEEKREEKKAKEEERKAKEEEKKAKEEEKKAKQEAERIKALKEQPRINTFFNLKQTRNPPEIKQSGFSNDLFIQFHVKTNMQLCTSQPPKETPRSSLKWLKDNKYVVEPRPCLAEICDLLRNALGDDVSNEVDEEQFENNETVKELISRLANVDVSHIQFFRSFRSAFVGCTRPIAKELVKNLAKNPLLQEAPVADYAYDSDTEFAMRLVGDDIASSPTDRFNDDMEVDDEDEDDEEEEDDDDEEDDDEDEDEGFLVKDNLVKRHISNVQGELLLPSSQPDQPDAFRYLRVVLLKTLPEESLDPFRIYSEPPSQKVQEPEPKEAGPLHESLQMTPQEFGTFLKTLNGKTRPLAFLIEVYKDEQPAVPKRVIKETIQRCAQRQKTEKGHSWVVLPEVLEQYPG